MRRSSRRGNPWVIPTAHDRSSADASKPLFTRHLHSSTATTAPRLRAGRFAATAGGSCRRNGGDDEQYHHVLSFPEHAVVGSSYPAGGAGLALSAARRQHESGRAE